MEHGLERLGVGPDVVIGLHEVLDEDLPVRRGLPVAGAGDPVDVSSDARGRGEFGRHPDNPIPVNGPIGEVLYLSHLRTRGALPLLFHRLGSLEGQFGNVDAYEVLPMEKGAQSERMFFSMYHPRKSRNAPKGYIIDNSRDPGNEIYGVNWLVEDFPTALDSHIREWQKGSLGVPLSINKVRTFLNGSPFAPSLPRQRHS